jgi:ABC-type bacteriocin/lantibiotic exporter with double-glycine peptidase domain
LELTKFIISTRSIKATNRPYPLRPASSLQAQLGRQESFTMSSAMRTAAMLPATVDEEKADAAATPAFSFDEVKQPVNMDFHSLTLTLKKNGRVLLKDICGTFKAGQITAIMGSSGCGSKYLHHISS